MWRRYTDMKTKCILAALLVAASSTFTASAQTAGGEQESEYAFDAPFWGLRASLDLSCPTKWKVGDNKFSLFGVGAGASLGAIFNYPFGGGLYVEPGLTFFYDTMDADYDISVPDMPWGDINRLDAYVGTWGLRIPLMVGYRIDFTPNTALFLSTGPQLEIGFSAHLSNDMPEGSSLAGELYDSLLRRFDCQWKFGAGVAFGYNYYVSAEASLGMINLSKQSERVSFHRNLVTVSVGYNF